MRHNPGFITFYCMFFVIWILYRIILLFSSDQLNIGHELGLTGTIGGIGTGSGSSETVDPPGKQVT